MRYTKPRWLLIVLALSVALSACNFGEEPEPTPDVGAIFTEAAETVAAQFSLELTQTAMAVPTATPPPTVTPVPTFAIGGSPTALGGTPIATFGVATQPVSTLSTTTPLGALNTQAGPRCRDSAFIADITYPDGTVVKQGSWVSKRWSFQNTGTCTWDDGFSLEPITGSAKKSWVIDEKKIKKVAPGEIIEVEFDLEVPNDVEGDWGGCWRMMGDDGYYFGTFLCLLVVVEK